MPHPTVNSTKTRSWATDPRVWEDRGSVLQNQAKLHYYSSVIVTSLISQPLPSIFPFPGSGGSFPLSTDSLINNSFLFFLCSSSIHSFLLTALKTTDLIPLLIRRSRDSFEPREDGFVVTRSRRSVPGMKRGHACNSQRSPLTIATVGILIT